MIRTTNLNKVTICALTDSEINILNYCKLLQYFKLKINDYIHQDKIAKRKFNMNEYINHNELYEQYKKQKQCIHCGVPFELILTKKNSNVTVDRKDNTNNCVLSCVECNRMKQ